MFSNDNIVVICTTAIAVVALFVLKIDAKDIAVAIGGGLVGYLGAKSNTSIFKTAKNDASSNETQEADDTSK